jgi:hypothetical protein
MAGVTGLRAPRRHLVYRGDLGRVTENLDPAEPGCLICGAGAGVDLSLLRTFWSP